MPRALERSWAPGQRGRYCVNPEWPALPLAAIVCPGRCMGALRRASKPLEQWQCAFGSLQYGFGSSAADRGERIVAGALLLLAALIGSSISARRQLHRTRRTGIEGRQPGAGIRTPILWSCRTLSLERSASAPCPNARFRSRQRPWAASISTRTWPPRCFHRTRAAS
jgi:hypothetical protein